MTIVIPVLSIFSSPDVNAANVAVVACKGLHDEGGNNRHQFKFATQTSNNYLSSGIDLIKKKRKDFSITV